MSNLKEQNEIYEKTLLLKFKKDKNKDFNEIINEIKEISEIYNIPLCYFTISKDKYGSYNYSLHYSFYINEMLNSGKIESYNIRNEIQDNMLSVTIDVKLKDGKDFSYTNYDFIDKDNINKKVIMLQKKTFISMMKFLFPDLYAKYNFVNLIVNSQDNLNKSSWQPKQQNTQNQQLQNQSEQKSSQASKQVVTQQNNSSKTNQSTQAVKTNQAVQGNTNKVQTQLENNDNPIVSKYRNIFNALRTNNNIDKDIFNDIIRNGINSVLNGKNPETEAEFQKLLVYASNAVSDLNEEQ